VVKKVIENHRASILVIRLRCYCPLLLLPKQAYPLAIFSTYTSPKHLANLSLLLVLHVIGIKELKRSHFPHAPLSFVIPRVYLALIAPGNLITLVVAPGEVLLCPRKA
jgi:hypothetical protein